MKIKNLRISHRCRPTPVLEILQKISEKFQKIMKSLKYLKMMFETEIGQIGLAERPNRAMYSDRAPVQIRADSESTNPDRGLGISPSLNRGPDPSVLLDLAFW